MPTTDTTASPSGDALTVEDLISTGRRRQAALDDSIVGERLDDLLTGSYEKQARVARRAYGTLKTAQIVCAALVPVLLALDAARAPAALAAAAVLGIEAVLQMQQFHDRWLRFRCTAEALGRELQLYLGAVGVYDVPDGEALLHLSRMVEQLNQQETRLPRSHTVRHTTSAVADTGPADGVTDPVV
jgi:hypothetical protein